MADGGKRIALPIDAARNYGYRKPSDLIEATDLFEGQRQVRSVLLRDKRRG